ncbi:MAG: RidA family protein [Rhodospirillales bacterium]|nr:RidA family protein [Rhodospirillales bacterium]
MDRTGLSHRDEPGLPAPASPFCHVVLDDRYAFFSGRVAADLEGAAGTLGDIAAETDLVLRSIRDSLADLRLGMDRIVRVEVHMVDLDEMPAMDAVYRGFFTDGRYPARTCVEVARLYGGCRVEITCTARL